MPLPDALRWLQEQSRDGEVRPAAQDIWTTQEILGLVRAVLEWNTQRQATLPLSRQPSARSGTRRPSS